jgi:hypothetical protein
VSEQSIETQLALLADGLGRLEEGMAMLTKQSQTTSIELAVLKTKAGLYGAGMGLVAGLAFSLIQWGLTKP